MRILIVDDDSEIRSVLEDLIKMKFFGSSVAIDIATAQDGEMALQMLRENGFDVVISDMRMPCMGGIELLKKVRKDEKLKSIPFFVMSSLFTNEDIREIAVLGAEYVQKPFFLDNSPLFGRLLENPLKSGVKNEERRC